MLFTLRTQMLAAVGPGLLLLAATAACAADAPPPPFYVRADIGISSPVTFSGDYALKASGLGGSMNGRAVGDVGIGYAKPISDLLVRAEIVGAKRQDFEMRTRSTTGLATFEATSTVKQFTVMGHLIAEYQGRFPARPFAGFGVGYARNEIGALPLTFNGVPLTTEGGTTRGNFAWTATGGLALSVSRNLVVEVSYRWLDAGNVRTSGIDKVFGPLRAVQSRFTTHEALVGLRYHL